MFRLDVVAFMWKRRGTVRQLLPEVRDLPQALTQTMPIAAPGVIHEAKAIVVPGDLVPHLGIDLQQGRESRIGYHMF